MPASRPLEERFWEKIEKRGLDECWPWTAAPNTKGYGQIKEGGKSRKLLLSHRMAYELHHGPIPDALFVLHTCDNPPCCNPSHLFLGTNKENMQDRNRKARQARGENIGVAKLTEEKVAEIRRDYVFGSRTHGGPALGRKYKVSKAQICNIVTERNWK